MSKATTVHTGITLALFAGAAYVMLRGTKARAAQMSRPQRLIRELEAWIPKAYDLTSGDWDSGVVAGDGWDIAYYATNESSGPRVYAAGENASGARFRDEIFLVPGTSVPKYLTESYAPEELGWS